MTTVRWMQRIVPLLLLALAALPVLAADPAPAAPPAPAAGEAAPAPSAEQQGEQLLRQMQRDNEAVITGRRFSYDPAGRRDPFEPLIKTQSVKTGPRPKGIKGMLVTEIALRGVATDVRGNPVAMFRGTDNRGYTLRVGDTVYDGRVIGIDMRTGSVTFRQQVEDPRRIKPFRDVIKRLQTKGGEEGELPSEEEGA